MKYNLTEIIDLIKERRTVFPEKYKSRKVHKEQIEKMLDAAIWAPNHGMTEPWRFVVFNGESLQQLMKMIADLYKHNTPEEQFLESKYQQFINRANSSSYVIAACMKRQESEKLPEWEEIVAVGCAVQNMMLVATAYGIGTFWSTPKFINDPKLKNLLSLNVKDKCMGLIYVGYPEDELPKGKRSIIYNKVEWRE